MPHPPGRRAGRDSYGRLVDLYNEDQQLSILVPRAPESNWPERALDAASSLLSLALQHPVARVREGRFTVFTCDVSAFSESHSFGLALQADLNLRTFDLLYTLLGGVDETIIESALLDDVVARPVSRYEAGAKIAYLPLGEPTPAGAPDKEWRSFELFRAESRKRVHSYAMPMVREKPPSEYSLKTWPEIRNDILRLFFEISLPGSYSKLKSATSDQFGIAVKEVPQSRIGHNGRLHVAWVIDRHGLCDVTIEVASELPNPLRYFVLAHELAHLALHFPLLIAMQAVEQIAWAKPIAENRFLREFEQKIRHPLELEESADELASYAVLPKWYDGDFDWIHDVDRTPTSAQMMWGALQTFFPETRDGDHFGSHRRRGVMLEREQTDLLRASENSPRSLYDLLLAAALRRGTTESVSRNHRLESSIYELLEFSTGLPSIDAEGDGSINQPALRHVGPEFRPRRQLYAPLMDSPNGEHAAIRWPIVACAVKGTWHSVLDPELPAATIEEWRSRWPELAIVAYPRKSLPTRPVSNFFLL